MNPGRRLAKKISAPRNSALKRAISSGRLISMMDDRIPTFAV
jgi:hypothetical protein